MAQIYNAVVLGASGYVGAETIRIIAGHPNLRLAALTANQQAGKNFGALYPHLHQYADMPLSRAEDVNWAEVEVAFGCLPHGASEELLAELPSHVSVIDLSADFRLRDPALYAQVYGRTHLHPQKTIDAVYGLTEFAREKLKSKPPIVACPGCYPTATLLALQPLLEAKLISANDMIIDAKSGVSGAGRSLKQDNLFCEIAESMHAYAVGNHRHAPEIEQELSAACGQSVIVNFTPHLVPMTRGEYVTCHVKMENGVSVVDLRNNMQTKFADEPFVRIAPNGATPDTRWVKGTNNCVIQVFADRIPNRAIIISTIDNLIKGSGGQAIQNFNVMFGLSETIGLTHAPLFP
ncbi:MAG: N-acetyl-gamma-glutamyl-phosphate reductase [Hyphomonadaceae bacterium]|nr:MAG: N-acetyl-gamma-glutamyl-phosphate reductase [Hyphomonadaceae bacterium]KAF0186006.1 MAG: N-acetyl-gamma-glutamyl-phosphate reductase [Hyphomonadaceae bacterium]